MTGMRGPATPWPGHMEVSHRPDTVTHTRSHIYCTTKLTTLEPSCTQPPSHSHTLLLLHTHGNLAFLAATNSLYGQLSLHLHVRPPPLLPTVISTYPGSQAYSCKTDESCQKQGASFTLSWTLRYPCRPRWIYQDQICPQGLPTPEDSITLLPLQEFPGCSLGAIITVMPQGELKLKAI